MTWGSFYKSMKDLIKSNNKTEELHNLALCTYLRNICETAQMFVIGQSFRQPWWLAENKSSLLTPVLQGNPSCITIKRPSLPAEPFGSEADPPAPSSTLTMIHSNFKNSAFKNSQPPWPSFEPQWHQSAEMWVCRKLGIGRERGQGMGIRQKSEGVWCFVLESSISVLVWRHLLSENPLLTPSPWENSSPCFDSVRPGLDSPPRAPSTGRRTFWLCCVNRWDSLFLWKSSPNSDKAEFF